MKKWLLRTAIALVALLIACAGLFVLRPFIVISAVSRILLWQAGFQSQYAQLGPYRIHYFVGGEGKPLVLIHGLGGDAKDLTEIATALRGSYRVYDIDLLGFGDSDKPRDVEYSIARQSQLLYEFFDSQRIEKAHVLGWSMGGWVSLEFASQWPERVDRLILVASAGMRFQPGYDVRYLNPASAGDVSQMLRIAGEDAPAIVRRGILLKYKREHWEVQRALDAMLTGKDALDGKLGSVTMPVLLLWGKRDTLIPAEVPEAMKREMPQSLLVKFDQCGHGIPVQCKDRILYFLRPFLTAEPPAAGGEVEALVQ